MSTLMGSTWGIVKELETAWSSASKLEEKSWVAREAYVVVTVTVQFGKSGIILSAVAMLVLQSTNLEFNEIVEYCHMEATLII